MRFSWLAIVVVGGVFSLVAAAGDAPVELRGPEVVPPRLVRTLDQRFLAWTRRDAGVIVQGANGLFLGDFNGEVRRELRCPEVAEHPVVEASVSPEGRLAGVLLEDGSLCVWDLQGTPNALGLRTRGVDHFALGVESVALGYDDGRVEVRDVRSGRRRWQRNFHLGGVTTLRFDQTGDRLAFSASKRGAALVDPRSGRLIRAFGRGPAWSIAFDDTHARIAAGLEDGEVEVVSTRDWQDAGAVHVVGGRVTGVDFAEDGRDLAVTTAPGPDDGADLWLSVWNFTTSSPSMAERMPAPAEGAGEQLRFSPHGSELVADNGSGWGRVWLRPEPPWRPFGRPLSRPALQRSFPEGSAPVAPLAVGPAEAVGVGGLVGPSSRLERRPREDGAPAWALVSMDGAGVAVLGSAAGIVDVPVASSDGARLLGRDATGALVVWDGRTGAALAKLAAPAGPVDSVRGRLVVLGADGRLFAALPGERGFSPLAGVAGATAVAVDPARPQRMVVGLADGAIQFAGLGGRVAGSAGFGERRFELGAGAVRALAFSPDGKRVVAVAERSGAGPVEPTWRTPAGAMVTIFAEEETESARPFLVLDAVPRAVSFSADGKRILAWDEWHLTVIDAATGAVQGVLAASIQAARFTPDGAAVEVVDPSGNLRRVAVGTGPVAWLPRGQRVALSGDDLRAVVVDGDIVEIWNGTDANRIAGLAPAGQAIGAVAIDPTSRHIALRYADGDVETYNALRVQVERRFSPGSEVGAPWVRFSDDGSLLWTTAGPRSLVAWTVATGAEAARVEVPGEGPLVPDPVERSPRLVALNGADGSPVAWVDTGADAARRLFLASEGRRPLAAAPGKGLVAFAKGNTIVQANMKGGVSPTAPFEVPGTAVAAAYTDHADKLAVADAEGFVRVYDDRGKLVATVDTSQVGPTGQLARPLVRVAFVPGDALLRTTEEAAAGVARVREWFWSSGSESGVVPIAPGAVGVVTDIGAAVVTPDGKRLYTGDSQGVVRATDLATGAQLALTSGHGGSVTALAVSPSGDVLSASTDGTIRVFEPTELRERVLVASFEAYTTRLAVAPDGQGFAALGDSGVVRTWNAKGRPLRRWRLPSGAITALRYEGAVAIVEWCGGGSLRLDPTTGGVSGAGAPSSICPAANPAEATAKALLGGQSSGPSMARYAWPLADGARLLAIGEDGRFRFWDVAARQLLGTVTSLDDGSWVIDRADGRRISSPSVRDLTAHPAG